MSCRATAVDFTVLLIGASNQDSTVTIVQQVGAFRVYKCYFYNAISTISAITDFFHGQGKFRGQWGWKLYAALCADLGVIVSSLNPIWFRGGPGRNSRV